MEENARSQINAGVLRLTQVPSVRSLDTHKANIKNMFVSPELTISKSERSSLIQKHQKVKGPLVGQIFVHAPNDRLTS